jgi:hypothetical protein
MVRAGCDLPMSYSCGRWTGSTAAASNPLSACCAACTTPAPLSGRAPFRTGQSRARPSKAEGKPIGRIAQGPAGTIGGRASRRGNRGTAGNGRPSHPHCQITPDHEMSDPARTVRL